jgi:hypothetical protein
MLYTMTENEVFRPIISAAVGMITFLADKL